MSLTKHIGNDYLHPGQPLLPNTYIESNDQTHRLINDGIAIKLVKTSDNEVLWEKIVKGRLSNFNIKDLRIENGTLRIYDTSNRIIWSDGSLSAAKLRLENGGNMRVFGAADNELWRFPYPQYKTVILDQTYQVGREYVYTSNRDIDIGPQTTNIFKYRTVEIYGPAKITVNVISTTNFTKVYDVAENEYQEVEDVGGVISHIKIENTTKQPVEVEVIPEIVLNDGIAVFKGYREIDIKTEIATRSTVPFGHIGDQTSNKLLFKGPATFWYETGWGLGYVYNETLNRYVNNCHHYIYLQEGETYEIDYEQLEGNEGYGVLKMYVEEYRDETQRDNDAKSCDIRTANRRIMNKGDILTPNISLYSIGDICWLNYYGKKLVLLDAAENLLWEKEFDNPIHYIWMDHEGYLEVIDNTKTSVWKSEFAGDNLTVSDCGNLEIKDVDDNVVWQTNTISAECDKKYKKYVKLNLDELKKSQRLEGEAGTIPVESYLVVLTALAGFLIFY